MSISANNSPPFTSSALVTVVVVVVRFDVIQKVQNVKWHSFSCWFVIVKARSGKVLQRRHTRKKLICVETKNYYYCATEGCGFVVDVFADYNKLTASDDGWNWKTNVLGRAHRVRHVWVCMLMLRRGAARRGRELVWVTCGVVCDKYLARDATRRLCWLERKWKGLLSCRTSHDDVGWFHYYVSLFILVVGARTDTFASLIILVHLT